jgi:carbonic anhydrase
MDHLLEGYRRFRDTAWPERRRQFEALAEHGQRPRAMVIACADSRVDPSMIFDTGPGEIFAIRNVANLVPPYQPDGQLHGTSAAVEFAVCGLGVSEVIVLGHAMCGGIAALLNEATQPGQETAGEFLGPWIRIAAPARNRVLRCAPADPQLECEHEAVRVSLDNLMSFPFVAERVLDGRLKLYGAHYSIRTGVLTILDRDGNFRPG